MNNFVTITDTIAQAAAMELFFEHHSERCVDLFDICVDLFDIGYEMNRLRDCEESEYDDLCDELDMAEDLRDLIGEMI